MLIELAVANYRSIKGEQRLSLVAGRDKNLREANTFQPEPGGGGAKKNPRLLRSAGLYGPNASGKTNLIRALATMRRMVSGSGAGTDRLPVEPFLLDAATRAQPTLFEVMVRVAGVRYQYGFSATAKRIHDEWLFAFPKGRAQRRFEREFFPGEDREEFTFGEKLTGDKAIWRRATRPDALFLSTAVGLNSRQLQPLFDWFKDGLGVVGVDGGPPARSLEWCQDDHNGDNKQRILKFLQAADFAIADLQVEEVEEAPGFPPDLPPGDLPPLPRQFFHQLAFQIKGIQGRKLFVVHRANDGIPVRLSLALESDGTQKMFHLAAPWLDALDHGRVLFVDGLHDNLHPLLAQFLVRLFHSEETNPKGAQLIFTTHETSILSDEYLRRDQIWFLERDENQASRLYSLEDFKLREGVKNPERAYRNGRYGALPFPRDFFDTSGVRYG